MKMVENIFWGVTNGRFLGNIFIYLVDRLATPVLVDKSWLRQ